MTARAQQHEFESDADAIGIGSAATGLGEALPGAKAAVSVVTDVGRRRYDWGALLMKLVTSRRAWLSFCQ